MQSHCLNHQEKVATHRCVSCLKPLCETCAQSYAAGIFCSAQCHDNAEQTSVRAAEIAKRDAELREWLQRQTAIKIITTVVIGFALFFGWDHLPAVFTDNVEKLWNIFKAFFKKAFP